MPACQRSWLARIPKTQYGGYTYLHPLPALRRMALHLLLVLQELLHLVRVWDISTLLESWPTPHSLLPRLEMREIVNVDPSPSRGADPTPMRNVRDRTLVRDDVIGLGIGQMLVEDTVESSRLVLVAVDAILDLLWSVLRRQVNERKHMLGVHGQALRG